MDINFYVTFNKARNSTARPSGTPVTLTGILKEECTIYEPVVKIAMDNFSVSTDNKRIIYFNYAYIPEFGRYYFVVDKVYTLGYWEFHLHCDVMATWRTIIGSTEQFIERSAVSGEVDDGAYQPMLDPEIISVPFNDIFADHPSILGGNWSDVGHGSYIVTMAGAPPTSSIIPITEGAVMGNTYVLNRDEFNRFRRELSTTSYTAINPLTDDITDNVAKVLINPFQYIIRCFYIPMTKAQIFGTDSIPTKHIRYGWYTLDAEGTELLSPLKYFELFRGNIPRHPLGKVTGFPHGGSPRMWRSARWSRYYITWPMIGTIEIDPDLLLNSDQALIGAVLDVFSGEVTLELATLKNGSTTEFQKTMLLARLNWGIDVPLSSYLRDPTSMQESVVSAAKSAQDIAKDIFTLNFAGLFEDTTHALTNAKTSAARAMAAEVQNTGGAGSFSQLGYPRFGLILAYCMPTSKWVDTDDGDKVKGILPEMGILSRFRSTPDSVGGISGKEHIIVCRNVTFSKTGSTNTNAQWSQVEYNEIVNYMQTGFYYV